MTKDELSNLLTDLGTENVSEGIFADDETNEFPRIRYFEFLWNDVDASGESYDTLVTYQISIFADRPRDETVLKLKTKLHELGLKPVISHEYLDDLKCFHSYTSIDVLEQL